MGVAEHEMIYATASVCLKCRLLRLHLFYDPERFGRSQRMTKSSSFI